PKSLSHRARDFQITPCSMGHDGVALTLNPSPTGRGTFRLLPFSPGEKGSGDEGNKCFIEETKP
ncbi:hypothetical protein PN462_02280, partial [Spirulina sp. CS-785/01]|uniref:hypothetical protein n=1 Tax=Spirulina sp. CS-785/01 TaxID=3021716 RepID=UPI00232DB59E